MNPLPRFVALSLFLVLTALVGLLTVPVWRSFHPANAAANPPSHATTPPTTSAAPPGNVFILSQRVALLLATGALALTVTLIFTQSLRSPRHLDSRPPFEQSRREMGTLARLAETSVAQGEELSRERDVRRRVEEDGRLKQQLLAQSLEEKIRLGHDLHDGIIQSLYAAGLMLESVRALIKSNPAEADRQLEETRSNLNRAIRDVRAYIVGLAPENLRRSSFLHSLSALTSELSAGRTTAFDLHIDEEAAALLSPEQSIEALQIAREAVSNALRHGHASAITLRMHRGDREVSLLVQDNGAGFNAASSRPGGHGLGNMRARAQRLGASLKITSEPGQGTRVLATLPILAPTAV